MTVLTQLVPQLKRFVAVPGQFADIFPGTTDSDLAAALADGWSAARMRGFMPTTTLDTNTNTLTPDITPEQGALIVLFTGVRMLQAEIRNRKTHTRYKAGAVESEVDYASSVLVELLRQYEAEMTAVLAAVSTYGASDAFWMADMAVLRAITVPQLDYVEPNGQL